jgi:tetratricopeptide (TPR) repeat protein
MKRLHLLFSILFIAARSFQLVAQTEGWDLIRSNDHKAARKSFETALQKDSLDEQALKGLLVLADMEQDNLGYRTYVRRLLNKYDDEVQFLVLENNYSGSAESILKKTSLSERAQIRSKITQADEKEQNRKFDDARKLRSNLFHKFNWSFLGPFKNISGSGFVNAYAPETETFNSSRSYTNPMGSTFSWVTPKYLPETGMLNAEDYCMSWGERSVYYANTFFETKTKTTVQLRVSREAPMKIWLDGSLVLEAKDDLNFTWDNEIVTLELPAGSHRMLVKTASAASAPRSYNFLEFDPGSGSMNSHYDFSDLFDLGGMFGGGYFGGSGNHGFCIRMTDANGKLVDAAPANGTAFAPQQYTTALTSMYALSELKKRTEKNPDDLFAWYLYSKAALDLKQTRQSEQYFVKALRKNPKLVFLKFLVARIYARNGKIEKTYETLNEIDAEKAPLFGEQYKKFEEIDLGIDPDRYFSSLNRLNAITPTNYSVINAFVQGTNG